MERRGFKPNLAVAEVAGIARKSGEPFTYDGITTANLLANRQWPYSDALQGFSQPLQERLLAGKQTLTFKPNGTIASQRRDAGH